MYFNILEKRSHPELNPRISAIEQLEPYKDRDDTFITFSTLNKLGLNPINIFGTPTGIYSYALKDKYESLKNTHSIEFAGERENCILFKAKNMNKILTNKASSSDLISCIATIRKIYPQYNSIPEEILYSNWYRLENKPCDELSQKDISKRAKEKNDMDRIWNLGRNVAVLNAKYNHKLKSDTWIQNEWARVMVALGYEGVYDSGLGIIHPHEKAQAVFFQTNFVELIKVLHNDLMKMQMSSEKVDKNRETYNTNREILSNIRLSLEEKGTIKDSFSLGATKQKYNNLLSSLIDIDNDIISYLTINKLNYTSSKNMSFNNCNITAKKDDVYIKNCNLFNTLPVNPKNKVILDSCKLEMMSSLNQFGITKNIFINNCNVFYTSNIGAKDCLNVTKSVFSWMVSVFMKYPSDLFNIQKFLLSNKASTCFVIFGKENEITNTSFKNEIIDDDSINLDKIDFGSQGGFKLYNKITDTAFIKDVVTLMEETLKNNPMFPYKLYLPYICIKKLTQK